MFTGIRSRLGRTVLFGLCATGMTVGLSAAPAGSAIGPLSAKLSVKYIGFLGRNSIDCEVSVDGVVRMTQTEAQALVNSGHKVAVRVWGEDPIYDDLLIGPYVLRWRAGTGYSEYIAATPEGLKFHLMDRVWAIALDEDSVGDPAGRDELYAGVRLVNSTGRTVRSGESNRVGGYDFAGGCSGRPLAARSGS